MDGNRVDALLSALAHSGRRRMLDLLMARPGMKVTELAGHFPMSRIAVIKHLRVLEGVDLVLSRKDGRCRLLFFNPVPIQLLHDRWTDEYSAFWSGRMADIKSRVESRGIEREEHKSA